MGRIVDRRDRIEIIESYSNYTPGLNFTGMVEHLLSTVPEKYLVGLDSVVLCNLSGLPQSEKRGTVRRSKRRMKRAESAGRYHAAWKGEKPWIQLFVDQIEMPPRSLRWIRPLERLCWPPAYADSRAYSPGPRRRHPVRRRGE